MTDAVPDMAPAAMTAPPPTIVTDLPEPGAPGFVRFIDSMGSDRSVASMARLSYGKGDIAKKDSGLAAACTKGDIALIRFLFRHAHTSPFEGITVKLHVKAPIFVARQWMRHRTASYNEYSQRYSEAPGDAPFFPAAIAAQPGAAEVAGVGVVSANPQGRAEALPSETNRGLHAIAGAASAGARGAYDSLIGAGVARETARGVLPVAGWTEFVVVQNLHNLFHFLALRLDAHSQTEIRAFSRGVLQLIEARFPVCVRAFRDYRLDAVRLTSLEARALRRLLASADVAAAVTAEALGQFANKREAAEWRAKLLSLAAPE